MNLSDPESLLIDREDLAAEERDEQPLLLREDELRPMLQRLSRRSGAIVLARVQGASFREIAAEQGMSHQNMMTRYRRAVVALRMLATHDLLYRASEDEVFDRVHSMGVRREDAALLGRFFVTSSYEEAARYVRRSRFHANVRVASVLAGMVADGYADEPLVQAFQAIVAKPWVLMHRSTACG